MRTSQAFLRPFPSPLLRLSLAAPLAVLAPVVVISLLALWLAASQIVTPLRDQQSGARKLAAGDFHAVEKKIRVGVNR